MLPNAEFENITIFYLYFNLFKKMFYCPKTNHFMKEQQESAFEFYFVSPWLVFKSHDHIIQYLQTLSSH